MFGAFLLLGKFLSGFRSELMYISLIENIMSSLTHLHAFQLLVLLPQFKEIIFSACTKRINLLILKFRQAINHCFKVLQAVKLAYANKTKESITSQKFCFREFWQIANSVLNKSKSAIPLLFNGPEVLSSSSDKAKVFAEHFPKKHKQKNKHNLFLTITIKLHKCNKKGTVTLKY